MLYKILASKFTVNKYIKESEDLVEVNTVSDNYSINTLSTMTNNTAANFETQEGVASQEVDLLMEKKIINILLERVGTFDKTVSNFKSVVHSVSILLEHILRLSTRNVVEEAESEPSVEVSEEEYGEEYDSESEATESMNEESNQMEIIVDEYSQSEDQGILFSRVFDIEEQHGNRTLDHVYHDPGDYRHSMQILDNIIQLSKLEREDTEFLKQYGIASVMRRWLIEFRLFKESVDFLDLISNRVGKALEGKLLTESEYYQEAKAPLPQEQEPSNSNICTFQEGCVCPECTNISEESQIGDYNGEYPAFDPSVLNSLPEDILREVIQTFYEERRSTSTLYTPVNTNFFNSLNEMPRMIFEEEEMRHRENCFISFEEEPKNDEESADKERFASQRDNPPLFDPKLLDKVLNIFYFKNSVNKRITFTFLDSLCCNEKIRSEAMEKILNILYHSAMGEEYIVVEDDDFLLKRNLEILNYLFSVHDDYILYFCKSEKGFNLIFDSLAKKKFIEEFLSLIINLGFIFCYDKNEFDYKLLRLDGFLSIIGENIPEENFECVTEFIALSVKCFVDEYIRFFFDSALKECNILNENLYNTEVYYGSQKRLYRFCRCLLEVVMEARNGTLKTAYYEGLKQLQRHGLWANFFDLLKGNKDRSFIISFIYTFEAFFIIRKLRLEKGFTELIEYEGAGLMSTKNICLAELMKKDELSTGDASQNENEDKSPGTSTSCENGVCDCYGNMEFDMFFRSVVEEHKECFNTLVEYSISSLIASFNLLLFMSVLNFNNKRSFLRYQINLSRKNVGSCTLSVERQNIFEDSYAQVMSKSVEEFKIQRTQIKFINEEGVDVGGLTREWFTILSREMVNPDYALFTPSSDEKVTYSINKSSNINPGHLMYSKFVGKIVAKSILEDKLLDVHFTRPFYKHILNKKCDLSDLESVDLDFYRSLMWMKNNPIDNVLDLMFSIDYDEFGRNKFVDLKENGRNIAVTDSNKDEYIDLIIGYKLVKGTERQI
jgi:hypothetical protein